MTKISLLISILNIFLKKIIYLYNKIWDINTSLKKLIIIIILNSSHIMYFMLIDAIVKIWNNDEIITPCNIINSFKITQISINLNGSEQHLLKKTDEINEEIILPNDVI